MSTRKRPPLSARAKSAWQRLLWGMGDLRDRLVAHGWWPAPSWRARAPNGGAWRVTGQHLQIDQGRATAQPQALLMPHDQCLWGDLQLPPMAPAALQRAVQESMWRVSPLPPEQIAVAWHAQPVASGSGGADNWQVHWGLSPRAQVDGALDAQGLASDAPVFFQTNDRRALAVQGAAQAAAARRQRRIDLLSWGVLALVLGALALPALMPLVLKRQAVVQSYRHLSRVEPQAEPLRAQLDQLREQANRANGLHAAASASVPLASVIDRISQALPDDTWLDRFEVAGQRIRIAGLTGNAGELMAKLARLDPFADLRSTAPTVRDDRRDKERFAFEMQWRGDAAPDATPADAPPAPEGTP